MDKEKDIGFKFEAPTPVIYLDGRRVNNWENVSIKELYQKAEELRKNIKKSIGYYWDNSHFKITNDYGKPVLSVGFFKQNISFWNDRTGDALFSIYEKVTQEDIEKIRDAIEQITDNKRLCLRCDKWVKVGETYSYAGFVCKDCYDPEIHLPPDPS